MKEFKDFSSYEGAPKDLGGVAPKLVVKDADNEYLLKFPRETLGIRINDHVSEYLGCKIAKELGYEVQEVELGYYNGKECVACTMFGQLPITFGGLGTSTLEGRQISYNLEEILELRMNKHFDMTQIEYEIEIWRMFSLDLLLGNYDRHQNNWGFLTDTEDRYKLAPLYDFGSTLSSRKIGFTDNKETDSEIQHSIVYDSRSSIRYDNRNMSFYNMAMTYKEEVIFGAVLTQIIEEFKTLDIGGYLDNIISYNEEYNNYTKFIKRVLEIRIKIYEEMGFIK